MPNVPELQSEAVKWQRRLSLLSSQGLNIAPAQELAKTDLQRLIQGGSPLAEDQIVSMVTSAYSGQVATPPAPQHADWNPMHVLGNIGKDVATDVRSFVPGLVHEGADIINPSKWAQVLPDVSKSVSELAAGHIADAAKTFDATPIIGSLLPGTFAASGGWSGVTEHPLNVLLSVLPIVSAGSKLATLGVDTAEAGTALSALKQGHPLEAVARATGLEQKLIDRVNQSSGPLSQFAHMPVWRAYNELVRQYSRRLATEGLTELKAKGLIGRGLSAEDSQRLVIDSQNYSARFENLPISIPPDAVALSGGDLTTLFQNVPAGRDVTAYAVTANPDFVTEGGVTSAHPLIDQTQIFWDKQTAAASLGPEMASHMDEFVHQVRVNPGNVSVSADGVFTGRNVAPNRTYVPGEGKQLQAIRAYSEKWQAKSLKEGPTPQGAKRNDLLNVVLPNPLTGKPEVYSRSSKVFNDYEASQAASGVVTAAAREVEDARNAVNAAQHAAAGRTETYAKYGESAEDAAKRPPTVPSAQSLYSAAQDFIMQGMQGTHRAQFEALDKAFQSGKAVEIKKATRWLEIALKKDGTGAANQARYARYLTTSATGLGKASEKAAAGAAKLVEAKATYDKAQRILDVRKKHTAAKKQAYMDTLQANPPDRFHSLIQEQARGHLIESETGKYLQSAKDLVAAQGAGLSEGLAQLHEEYVRQVSRITGAHTKEELANFVDAATLKTVEKNAFQDWVQMAKAGYDPIWTHDLSVEHYDHMTWGKVKPLPLKYSDAKSAREAKFTMWDQSPKVLDIGAVLTAHAVDYLQEEATKQFVDFMMHKSGAIHPLSEVTADMEKRFGSHAAALIKREYVPFHPPAFVRQWKNDKNEYVIPKSIEDGFSQLFDENSRLPFFSSKPMQVAHRAFKVSVLTGPRHMVHIALGGLVMTGLQDPGALLEMIARPKEVFRLLKNGEMPKEVLALGNLNTLPVDAIKKGTYEETVDQIHGFRSGMKLGEWWRQSKVGKLATGTEEDVNKLENMVTDFYRGSILLHQARHGATNESALALVNKTLIDVDNLTPFEATIIRQIFPFYSYTKHILRYVMTYPSDHPLRASILSNIASHVEKTNGTGDPARLSKLFFLGEPDASGKVSTVDMSNLNPFRSMSSVFSMTGFLMGLAPEMQVGLKALGINPATGTLSSHQNYSYDAYTGTNVASRPKLNIFDFASTFIPQVDIMDHFLLFTDTMRQLKKNNPEAYQRSLYQEMNLPFAVAPINVYDVRAKAAAAQYRDASTAVANAMATGNTHAIRTFETVPFEGYLYPADQVANYIDNFDKIMPGVAPKAIQRPPKRKKTRTLGGLL